MYYHRLSLNDEIYEVLRILHDHFNDVAITILRTKRSKVLILGYSTYIVDRYNLNIFFVEIGNNKYYL